jgi:hypothetical protein
MRIWSVRVVTAAVLMVACAAAAALFPEWAPVLAGFLFGVLGAGVGAVVQAMIVDDRRDRALRRALVAEIRENLVRLGGPEIKGPPAAGIVRVTWDAARSLPLDDHVFDAIAEAYRRGAGLEMGQRWSDSRLTRVDRPIFTAGIWPVRINS